MSPTRPSSSRPGRHHGSALRLPLVAGLSLALAVPALAACQDETGPSSLVRVQRLQQCLTIQPSRPARARSRRTSPPTPVGTASIGWAPSWEFPQSQPGWEVTVYDTDGKNKMDKSNGCVFSATQNLFDTSAKGDRTQSEHRADSILDSYKTSSHLSNVSTRTCVGMTPPWSRTRTETP